MSHRFLIGIGVAFFAVLAFGVAAVVGVTAMSESAGTSSQTITSASVVTTADPTPAAAPALQPRVAADPTPRAASPALPNAAHDTGVTVQDSDIAQLADAVKLGRTNSGAVSKEVWVRETPIAQRLLNGLCDCDQRNWLKHFVQTGNEAINGSENYYQSVQLLATLRRSNADIDKGRTVTKQ
jgi:hypothetical protein